MQTLDRAWFNSLLLLLAACAGGQSGDDGHPVDRPEPDAGARRDSGPSAAEDAGAPMFVGSCCGALDGPAQMLCAAGIEHVAGNDPTADAFAAPYKCVGMEGYFDCVCGDTPNVVSFAAGCIGALREACDKDPDPIEGGAGPLPSDCETTLDSRAGRCERTRDGEYTCDCEGAAKAKLQKADSCDRALWAACGKSCEDATGKCAVDENAAYGHYACDCPQNKGIARNAVERSCALALLEGCGIDNRSALACNGYSGFCDLAGDEYMCTCSDGTHGASTLPDAEDLWSPCRDALGKVCGFGAPDGKLCFADKNGYQARCVQPFADDAPFTCECVFHGIEAATQSGWSDVEQVTGMDCEDAMVSVCPQVVPLREGARARVCDYYDRCEKHHVGFALDKCNASAPEGCVACTDTALDTLDKGKDGCPSDRVACDEQCKALVPKSTAVTACEQALEAADKATPEANCLCGACWPDFGECMADAGCAEMLDCVTAQGCSESTCESDPVCGPIIKKYYSTHSLSVLLRVGSCPALGLCAPP